MAVLLRPRMSASSDGRDCPSRSSTGASACSPRSASFELVFEDGDLWSRVRLGSVQHPEAANLRQPCSGRSS